MTQQQAEALGIVPRKKTRTTKRVVKGAPYHTVCTACGEEFHMLAAEDRHLKATKHGNYRLVLGY